MYEIDSTFFIGQINIPNSKEPRGKEGVNIDYYIEKGCYLFLYNLLGHKLYAELKSNLDVDLNLKSDADQKWKDLFYGKTYGDKVFKGLVQNHKTFKTSVLANYVFWYWLKDSLSKVSGVGSITLEAKNAENASSDNRARDIWNSIVLDVGENKVHNNSFKRVYCHNNTKFTDYSGLSNYSNEVTIKQFLLDHSEDYPNPSLQAPLGYVYEVQNWLGL